MGSVAPGPIPYESMLCYAERAGIEDVEDFCTIISSMDDGYLKEVHAEIEKKNKAPQSRSRTPKR